MDIAQIYLVLSSKRWLIAACGLAFALLALLMSLVMTPKYVASASVVIDSSGLNPTTGQSSGASEVSRDSIRATQLDIATSNRVARRVVTNLGLHELPEVREEWQSATDGQGDAVEWMVDRIKRRLDVGFGKDSNVLDIHYTAADPRLAALTANGFADAYLQTTLDLRTDYARRSADFFDARVKTLRAELEQARAELSSFERQNKIVSSDERYDIENWMLNNVASQYSQAQSIEADASSRKAVAGGSASTSPDVLQNTVIQALRTDIAREEAQLRQTADRLGENHPDYQAAQQRLQDLRASLDAETRQVASSVARSGTIHERRLAKARAALEAQRARVLDVKDVRDSLAVLQRRVENAQKTYDLVLTRYSQTSLESQSGLNTAVLLTAAVPPLKPVSPRALVNVPIAAIVGVLFGAFVALLLEQYAPRFRREEDFVQALGIPLLAIVPMVERALPGLQEPRRRLRLPGLQWGAGRQLS